MLHSVNDVVIRKDRDYGLFLFYFWKENHMQNVREDCFAWECLEEYCTATTKEECTNCHFYKHSDNPFFERKKIEREIVDYSASDRTSPNPYFFTKKVYRSPL